MKYPRVFVDLFRSQSLREALYREKVNYWNRVRSSTDNSKPKTKLFNDLVITLNPKDESYVSASIAATGWIDLAVTCLLKKVIKQGMRVMDVGANIVYYTLLLSKLNGGNPVYSFEPEINNLSYLRENVNSNDLRNVTIIDAVLSDREGTTELYESEASRPNEASLVYKSGGSPRFVRSMTADGFWKSIGSPRIDFIKNHVRGGENLVLRGAKELIQSYQPMILTVIVPEMWAQDEELLSFLHEYYNFFKLIHSPRLTSMISKTEVMQAPPARGTELFLIPR